MDIMKTYRNKGLSNLILSVIYINTGLLSFFNTILDISIFILFIACNKKTLFVLIFGDK